MSQIKLECSLCGSIGDARHLLMPLSKQSKYVGEHLHLCEKCASLYYSKDLLDSIALAEATIVKKYLAIDEDLDHYDTSL